MLEEEYLYVEVDGSRIAYQRSGQGEPMLLLHGITTYSFIWRRLIPDLTKNFDVLAPDLLGCGQSDKPVRKDFSIMAQAGIFKEFLEKLGIERIHLVTHDIGGGIGQIMAVKHADLVSDLVLINTVGYDYWPVQPITSMRIPFIRRFALAAMDLFIFTTIVHHGLYHKERMASEELKHYFEKQFQSKEGKAGFLRLAECLDNQQLLDITDGLKELQIPVLIIRGAADPYLPAIISERLYKDIPNARLEIIKTGGHFIQEDEPEILTDLIREFIHGSGQTH
jgi:pimeloyl-ACP methyl ester carboxylesterase